MPQSLIDAQFAAAAALFALPEAARMAVSMALSANSAGYERIGAQRLDSQDTTAAAAPPDLKESFQYGMELPPEHPLALQRRRGFGHNLWPALPGFRTQALAYRDAMGALGDRVLALLALSLDLPEDWFAPSYQTPHAMVRLLRYPPQPAPADAPTAPAANQIGAGAHTDWGGITLLAQDGLGGLEVRTRDAAWIAATPVPGTFVVNLGDLMARWTNGIYTSNMHRVRNNHAARDRYAIAHFYSPNPDAVIAPPANCVTPDRPRQFATCTAAEHLDEMFRRSYGFLPARAA